MNIHTRTNIPKTKITITAVLIIVGLASLCALTIEYSKIQPKELSQDRKDTVSLDELKVDVCRGKRS